MEISKVDPPTPRVNMLGGLSQFSDALSQKIG